ncbi:hypothetical protein [Primorskyibacter sp. 2E233]|uniref:hypothetical protein n=1 Tax=Primorskyibacter sp. 2E233 TaxID=3413431 RepID=UPI003BEF5951
MSVLPNRKTWPKWFQGVSLLGVSPFIVAMVGALAFFPEGVIAAVFGQVEPGGLIAILMEVVLLGCLVAYVLAVLVLGARLILRFGGWLWGDGERT